MLATGNSQLAFLARARADARHRVGSCARVPHGRVRRALAVAFGELPALHARAGRREAAGDGVPLPRRRRAPTPRPKPRATRRCCARIRSTSVARGSARTATSRSTIRRSPTSTTRATSRSSRSNAASRRQQVGEGHFASIDDVPTHAITVTIPALLRAARVLVIVPEARKAKPVHDALYGPITTACPASILRRQAERDAVPRPGVVGAPRIVSALPADDARPTTRTRRGTRRCCRSRARASCAAACRRSIVGLFVFGFAISVSVRAELGVVAVGRVPPGPRGGHRTVVRPRRRARRPGRAARVDPAAAAARARHRAQHAVGRLHRQPRPVPDPGAAPARRARPDAPRVDRDVRRRRRSLHRLRARPGSARRADDRDRRARSPHLGRAHGASSAACSSRAISSAATSASARCSSRSRSVRSRTRGCAGSTCRSRDDTPEVLGE